MRTATVTPTTTPAAPVEPINLKQLYKEFAAINRKSVYLEQAHIEFPKGEENPLNIVVVLRPTTGIFRNSEIKFELILPPNYPQAPPKCTCLSKLFHPNVSSTDGKVCFSMFSADFNKSYGLENYINGLLWFVNNPNPDSALDATCVVKKAADYEKIARFAAMGRVVRGKTWQKILLVDDPAPVPPTAHEFAAFMQNLVGQVSLVQAAQRNGGDLGPPAVTWLETAVLRRLQATVVKTRGLVSASVAKRAKRLVVEARFVLKELLFRVGDKLVLVVTNGHERVNENVLKRLVGGSANIDCSLVERTLVQNEIGFSVKAVPAFGHDRNKVSVTVMNSRLLEPAMRDEFVYTATGVANLLMKVTPSELQRLLTLYCSSGSLFVVRDLHVPIVQPTSAVA